MASTYVHPRITVIGEAAEALIKAAGTTAKATANALRRPRRRHSYSALRPGSGTPLWNELARACQQQLKTYGEKAKLARILGVPRQRLHLFLVSKTACPDAERTLQLLAWLNARRSGSDLL